MTIETEKRIRELEAKREIYKHEAMEHSPASGNYNKEKFSVYWALAKELKVEIVEIEEGIRQC